MGKIFRVLLLTVMVFQLLSLPAYASWKHKVAGNEKRAAEYIGKLQSGADPGRTKRPTVRFISHYQAMQEQDRFFKAMDEAEALARQGKYELLPDLLLKFQELEKAPDVAVSRPERGMGERPSGSRPL